MTPRSLFSIILKVLGIFFIKDILITIPSLLSVLMMFGEGDTGMGFYMLFASLLLIGCYVLVAWFLLFRTDWLIDQLQLDKGFGQGEFSLNIHRSTVLSISVIVIGGLMAAEAIPDLLRLIYGYFQEKRMTMGMTRPAYGPMLWAAGRVVVGLLLMGNQRAIVNFIERKRKTVSPQSIEEQQMPVSND